MIDLCGLLPCSASGIAWVNGRMRMTHPGHSYNTVNIAFCKGFAESVTSSVFILMIGQNCMKELYKECSVMYFR